MNRLGFAKVSALALLGLGPVLADELPPDPVNRTPPALGFWLAGAIHGAALVPLDAAHLSQMEQSAAFNRAMVSFLAHT